MTELLILKDKLLQKFAYDFVDIYTKQDRYSAGVWAEKHIGDFEVKEAREYITKEFKSRNYYFDKGGK